MALSAPVPLADHHELEEFSCAAESLNEWLKKQARKNAASGASRVFVCCEGDSHKVMAYYSLSASSVIHAELPGKAKRNMPDPVPVILLGRLAVDASLEGKGIGRSLFKDAAHRINQAGDQIGIAAIVVHPLDDNARAFWLKQGFMDCPGGEQRMMVVTMKDVRTLLGQPPAAEAVPASAAGLKAQ